MAKNEARLNMFTKLQLVNYGEEKPNVLIVVGLVVSIIVTVVALVILVKITITNKNNKKENKERKFKNV